MIGERVRRGTAPGTPPARGASPAVKLAQTPTCCSAPASSKRPSSSEPTAVAVAVLVPAKAGDDAVAVALVLDLEHDALVRLVGAADRLGHHAVEPGAFEALEPVGGDGAVACRGREVDRRLRLRRAATRARRGGACERLVAEIAVADAEQVEEDDGGRDLLRPASSRATPRDGCAAAAHRSRGRRTAAMTISPSSTQRSGSCSQQRLDQLGEVAVERLLVAALDAGSRRRRGRSARESRPTWARRSSHRRRGSRRRAWRASEGPAVERRGSRTDGIPAAV